MMVGDDGGSSSVTSSPLQYISSQTSSPTRPVAVPPAEWLKELKSDERGLYLIHLLLNCAASVSSGNLEHANTFLDHISLLSSPSGDTMQRIATVFSSALARRLLRSSFPGILRSFDHLLIPPMSEIIIARRIFFDLCPFVKIAFLISNQGILEAMEGEKLVHVVDIGAEPATVQWIALLQALAARPEGPPHLRITAVGEHKEALDLAAARLSDEAEKLDVPFQFNAVVSSIENLDLQRLRVKTGEAVAISAVLQLHRLLAPESIATAAAAAHRLSNGGPIGELPNKDLPDSAASGGGTKMERFLTELWSLSPKITVVAEQESDHNGESLVDRFLEALNFYAALFDCLECTSPRTSPERAVVERALLGEEVRDIVAGEGSERRERHERLERWVGRMEAAGFVKVAVSYYGLLQARRLLQSIAACEGFKLRDDGGCVRICWQDRVVFSVSVWSCSAAIFR